MGKEYEGMLIGEGLTFGLVVSRFNELITSKLLEGARDALSRHGVREEDVEIAKTPGAFEIPLVAKKMAQTGKYDGIICLGAVIRGGTPHFDYIASQVSKGVASASLELGLPITFGIITADTLEQAIERAGTKMGNAGFQAGLSAIEMASLLKSLSE
ncbi:MAG: 6,7-dimethyl-8-ribityllumazine synthase [Dehalococcoidia bacterium]